ncbi:MAG: bifunctional homocysteine S-methyltransferase/methylenetetrahydrofolate reductase [Anaerolineae bacterium]|nr:bifunctional homocysteine S-methyltransferase/methylenetetrahydrofolate reductase [Anaerolineae bacterium]
MNRIDFRQKLAEGALLLDGAMGTVLHSRGVALDQSFDILNCRQPAVVAAIHRAYIDAGADIIETNSFSANRFKLAEHGLEDSVTKVNAAAVNVARRVIAGSFKPILLAGSVGPLGVRLAPLGRVPLPQAQLAFTEQIQALVNPSDGLGVDLLIIETMSDLMEIKASVNAAREVAPDMPIIVMMTFSRDDRTLLGLGSAEIAIKLSALDVDVIGVNCSGGPAQVLRLIVTMRELAPDTPIAAVPNAGWPEQTAGGRVMYPATPAYFADYTHAFVEAGAAIVGGCCGTDQRHIAAMRAALDAPQASSVALPVVRIVHGEQQDSAPADPPTRLARALANGEFVVTAEMRPPKGIAAQKMLAGAQMLKEVGANFLDVADVPLARMRMGAWAAAHLIQKEIGLETILHFPTRGRSLLRVQSDLLAAHALGIRNLFVTMGDPARIGDYPEAMDSYDIVPTGLIELISQQFDRGLDKAGAQLDQPTNFVVGCALSLNPAKPEHEARLLAKKIRSGADFALTQPVFDAQQARDFIALYEAEYGPLTLPLIAGIMPLFNSRNALFLHNEVPGIIIPEMYRQRMDTAADPQAEGVAIAAEIVAEIRPIIHGVYLMPAFGRYDLVADVIDRV